MEELLPYPFLIEIRKVEIKIIGIKPFLFKISYNGYFDIEQYKQNLEISLHKFYQRITYLPQSFREKDNRASHLIYLRELLHFIQADMTDKHKELVNPKFPICKKLNINHFYKFAILNIANKEKFKLFRMICLQKEYLEKSITIVEQIAEKERIRLLKDQETYQYYNFKTKLTNEVLSLVFKIFFDIITEHNYNKKELAKFLANSFETKNTKSPSEKKLYHHFTQHSPETIKKVRELLFELKIRI